MKIHSLNSRKILKKKDRRKKKEDKRQMTKEKRKQGTAKYKVGAKHCSSNRFPDMDQ